MDGCSQFLDVGIGLGEQDDGGFSFVVFGGVVEFPVGGVFAFGLVLFFKHVGFRFFFCCAFFQDVDGGDHVDDDVGNGQEGMYLADEFGFFVAEVAKHDLVDFAGRGVAVADDGFAGGQGGEDFLFCQLGPGGVHG